MSLPYQGLICDCDGVLLDSEAVALSTLLAALAHRHEREALAAFLRPRLGMTIFDIGAELSRELDIRLDQPTLAALGREVEARCAEGVPAVPGVFEAIATLPVPRAVASNSSRERVEAGLRQHGLWDVFGGHVHTPDTHHKPKPAPDLYLAAARGLACAPQQCLVIEDSVAGVTAAVAAGCTVLGFTGTRHDEAGAAQRLLAAGARAVFDQMNQLPARLAVLAAG
ncbi:HAD-IA family hydrolase [Chitinimonas sp.]|uniref:HAD family hydrolase n=1 Tax=Chitinimonas sp. TaxID=1934313 RepID=UPI002F92B5F1